MLQAMEEERQGCSSEQQAARLAKEFICPICLEVISQATWLMTVQPQLYDRRCLIRWFEAGAQALPPRPFS